MLRQNLNAYVVKGRLDVSGVEDNPSLPDLTSFKQEKLLPATTDDATTDDAAMKSNFFL